MKLRYKERDIVPIFVTGCQRSGTTMLASQMGNSKNSFALPEFPVIFDYMESCLNDRCRNKPVAALNSFRFSNISLPRKPEEYSEILKNSGFESFCNEVISDYIDFNSIDVDGEGTLFWIEHSPKSRNYLSLISTVFNEYYAVHIVRDPRSVYASMKQLPEWPMNDPAAFSIMWNDAIARCFSFEKLSGNRMFCVRYEDYVNNSEMHLRDLCGKTGLAFEKAMLNGGAIVLPKFTAAQHSKVNSGSSKGAGEDWVSILSAREVVAIEMSCVPFMKVFNYELSIVSEYSSIQPTLKIFGWLLKGLLYKPYSKVRYYARNYRSGNKNI